MKIELPKLNLEVIPETELDTYSPSQIGVWKDCPQKWFYNYRKGLRRSGSTKALDLGTYVHELSHVYYNTIEQTNHKPGSDFLYDMMMSRIRSDIRHLTPANIEVVNTAAKLMLEYIKFQSPGADKNIAQILGVELEFKVPVYTPKGRHVLLHGIIDLVYIDHKGRVRIRDHKTSGKKGSWDQKKLSLDQQLMIYLVAIAILLGRPVFDVEINFMNTYPYKDKRPFTELFQIIPWTYTAVGLEKATERVLELIDIMLDTPVYRNYTKECASCPYYDLCELELRGLDTTPVELSGYTKRDVKNEPGPKVADFFNLNAQEHADGNKDTGPFSVELL